MVIISPPSIFSFPLPSSSFAPPSSGYRLELQVSLGSCVCVYVSAPFLVHSRMLRFAICEFTPRRKSHLGVWCFLYIWSFQHVLNQPLTLKEPEHTWRYVSVLWRNRPYSQKTSVLNVYILSMWHIHPKSCAYMSDYACFNSLWFFVHFKYESIIKMSTLNWKIQSYPL